MISKTLIAAISLATVYVYGQQQKLVSDSCLGCICEAISGCDINAECNGDVCGLFGITQPFWDDAKKPVLNFDNPQDPQAWVRCVKDPGCAGIAVNGYMERYGQDCNNDGRVDCYDYALIHKLGGSGCHRNVDRSYWATFTSCQQQVARLGLGR